MPTIPNGLLFNVNHPCNLYHRCGHCKRLAPTWDKLAEKLNSGDEVTLARVDCTEQTSLCSDHDVTGYPT